MSTSVDLDAIAEKLKERKAKPKPKDPKLIDTSGDLVASGGDESVCVCIRVRPFNRRELEIHAQKNPNEYIRSVIEMPEGVGGELRVLDRDANTGEYAQGEEFTFTKTFWSVPAEQQPFKYQPITQEDVFDVVGRTVLANAVGGYNCCVFAYGQTGSGKTHTMMGDFRTKDAEFVGDPGIIPRLCRELFEATARRKEQIERDEPRVKIDFDVKLSAIEIYNEQVKDLFWQNTSGRTKNTVLKVRVHPTEGAFVDQLTVLNPKSWVHCLKLIASGVEQRTVAATLMNDESSRSHSIFQIIVTQTEALGPPPEEPHRKFEKPVITTRVSRINLVDLAGSERLKKSGAQGQQLKEAAGINQSLSTLKKVIDALVTNGTERNPKKHVMVPYRESALTHLLSHSLGGNSKTTMIACVSPHYDNQEETVLTLRYANRTKGIVNHVKSNENNAQRQAMLLQEQIAALQKKLEEGPQEYDDTAINDLRDQLDVGKREMEEMQRKQREKEEEARRLQAAYKSQKDARYAATYYNSFKRAFLQKIRDRSEGKLKDLELQFKQLQNEKDKLQNITMQRERSAREASYNAEELKRRSEQWSIKSARNEATARQLVRDIAKARQRGDENLTSRFGLVWIRNNSEKQMRKSLEERKEAIQKDHEQYMQSISREAKKQFDILVETYADREHAMQERLQQMERGRSHAQQQYEKAQHLLISLQNSVKKSEEDYIKQQKAREDTLERRFEQMKSMYVEKIEELQERKRTSEVLWQNQLDETRRKGLAQNAAKVEELEVALKQLDVDGERRVQEVINEAKQQLEEVLEKSNASNTEAMEKLQKQFDEDEASLLHQCHSLEARAHNSRAKLQDLYHYTLNVAGAVKHCESALLRAPQKGKTDFMLLRRKVHTLVQAFTDSQPHDFQRAAVTLRKGIPSLPESTMN